MQELTPRAESFPTAAAAGSGGGRGGGKDADYAALPRRLDRVTAMEEEDGPDVFAIDDGDGDGDDDGDEDDDGEGTTELAAASASTSSIAKGEQLSPRSIDEFFEEAYASSSRRGRMRYWLIFVTLGLGNMGDSTELTSIGYLMANEEFQDVILHDNFAVDGSIVASVALAGMIIGGLVAGAFEDTLGRKRTLLGGLSLNAVSCVLCAFAPNVAVLSACRLLVGLGVGAILSSLMALSAELSPPSRRGLSVTVVSGFWSFGMLYAAIAANAVMGALGMSWRAFVAVTAVPTAASVLLVLHAVPDSARFLALHGRYDEAARRANQVAEQLGYAGEGLRVEEVRHHFPRRDGDGDGDGPAERRTTAEGTAAASVDGSAGRSAPFREALANVSALYSEALRNRTVSLQLLWIFLEMGSGLGSFINVIFEEIGAGAYVGSTLAAIGNLVGSVLGAAYLDSLGRKSSILLSMILASLMMMAAAWVVRGESHPMLPLALSTLLFAGFVSLAWNANMTLSSEMFPTKVRSTGLGYVAATGRIACIGQQFINGALVDRPGILLIVASLLLLVGASTMLLLKTHDMARQPLSDAVAANGRSKAGGGGSSGRKYIMVSLGKEGSNARTKEEKEPRRDLPALV